MARNNGRHNKKKTDIQKNLFRVLKTKGYLCFLVITACVQSTREGNVFTLSVRPRGQGVPQSLIAGPFWEGEREGVP